MSYTVKLVSRTNVLIPEDSSIKFEPKRYSKGIGGPVDAEILVSATRPEYLWRFFDYLRYRIELWDDETGDRVWWGYIHEVEVPSRNPRYGVRMSLEYLANRVSVIYSYLAPGSSGAGVRRTTTWAEDSLSVADYGKRELVLSLSSATDEMATLRRDAAFDLLKLPISSLSDLSERRVKLLCRGWYDTLNWTYVLVQAGIEQNELYDAEMTVGRQGTGSIEVDQTFQISTAWYVASIGLMISGAGTVQPSDNFIVEIYADSGGSRGTLLGSGQLAGSEIPSYTGQWTSIPLSSMVSLAASTPYHLGLKRSIPASGNYYVTKIDEGLNYASGAMQIWNGSSWSTRSPDADLTFRIEGAEETTTQVKKMIDQEGQFLGEVYIEKASGLYTNQYRNGETLTGLEVQQLLESGCSDGSRLILDIEDDLDVRIKAEPVFGITSLWQMKTDGSLVNPGGTPIPKASCPALIWMQFEGATPPISDLNLVTDPSVGFVEFAEYNVDTGEYLPRMRGIESVIQEALGIGVR